MEKDVDVRQIISTDMCSAVRRVRGEEENMYIISCESPDSGGSWDTGVEIFTKEGKLVIKYECKFCNKEHRIIINLENLE